MTIFHTTGGINKYPHHKQVLVTFPNVARATIFNKRNLNCDRVIIWVVVLPRDGDEVMRKTRRLVRMMKVKVRKKVTMPDNAMDPKLRMNQCNKPNHNQNINNTLF